MCSKHSMDTTRSYALIWGGSKTTRLAVMTSRFEIPRALHCAVMYSRCVLELETAVTRDLGYLAACVGHGGGSGYMAYTLRHRSVSWDRT